MKRILEGKNAVITGTRRGIGKAAVQVFAENGANIWACARRYDENFEAEMALTAAKYGVWIKPVYFDIADRDAIKAAVKQILGEKQAVDILLNNAGITYNALIQMTSMEKLQEVMTINFENQLYFTQLILKLMLRNPVKHCSIVNISSSAALDGNAGRSAYGASKASVACMTKAIAEELGSSGIRANSIAPGITDTDMVEQSMSSEVISSTVEKSCLGRMGQPREIAEVAAFLASDLSSYITGQIIRADGGM